MIFRSILSDSPWTARRSNQSILKEISLEYSLEGLMLKLKLQYFGHLHYANTFLYHMFGTSKDAKSWLIWKDPDAGKDWGQEEKGTREDEMVGWDHQLDGHGFGWTPGVGDGQGGLACCSSWGHKESDMTEQLNWTELVAQMVKNPSAMWETWVCSLGWEDPLEEGMETHSSILAWRIPMDRGAW